MITLATTIAGATIRPAVPSFALRGARGQLAGLVVLPGAHYRIEARFPTMAPAAASRLQAQLELAKTEGLRMNLPLLGVSQGNPGSPVVDGSGAAGTALPLTGLTPGYVAKAGYWLTVIDADGARCLHRVAALAQADGSGEVELTLVTPLRTVLADGDVVLLARPTIDGFVTSDLDWDLAENRLVTGHGFTLEEAEA